MVKVQGDRRRQADRLARARQRALTSTGVSTHCLQREEQRPTRDLEGGREAQGRNEHGRWGNPAVVTTDSRSSKTSKLVREQQEPQEGDDGNVIAGEWETRFPVTAWRDETGGDTSSPSMEGKPSQGVWRFGKGCRQRAALLTSVRGDGSVGRRKRSEPQGRMRDATSSQAGRWRKPSRW